MIKKIFALAMLLILFSLAVSGCGNPKGEMRTMSVEDVMDSLIPFDESVLQSEQARVRIEAFLEQLNPQLDTSKGHYAIGDLSGDNVPEIVMYIERDPENIDDQGRLIVYAYDSSAYAPVAEKPMNYDNTNYLLKIGNVSEDQRGILLSNQVGSKAGVTYGFVLEDRELSSILNPKKINLFSVNTENRIDDIDGDGVLEFSIFSIDPESQSSNPSEAEVIELWYRWDGRDGAEVVKFATNEDQHFGTMEISGSFGIQSVEEETNQPYPGEGDFRSYLLENPDGYNPSEITKLLEEHILSLEVNKSYRSLDIGTLFAKHTKDVTSQSFLDKYSLSKDRLNDKEYLQRDRILQAEPDLKELLLKNLRLGYALDADKDQYIYHVDYRRLHEDFGQSVTNEFRNYLGIMSKWEGSPHRNNGRLALEKESLAARIVEIELFRLTFSYSEYLDQVLQIYQEYMESMLYYTAEGLVFDENTGSFNNSSRQVLQDIVNLYPDSHMAEVINHMLQRVRSNNGNITPDIRDEISKMLP